MSALVNVSVRFCSSRDDCRRNYREISETADAPDFVKCRKMVFSVFLTYFFLAFHLFMQYL